MSAPDFGIDAKYAKSDQRAWLIKCEHCGKYQEMSFDKNIEIVDEHLINRMIGVVQPGATRYVCQFCHKSLEASRWYNGHWEKKFPDQGRPVGFFVSQLNAVWLSSDQIYANSLSANSKQIFYKLIVALASNSY